MQQLKAEYKSAENQLQQLTEEQVCACTYNNNWMLCQCVMKCVEMMVKLKITSNDSLFRGHSCISGNSVGQGQELPTDNAIKV